MSHLFLKMLVLFQYHKLKFLIVITYNILTPFVLYFRLTNFQICLLLFIPSSIIINGYALTAALILFNVQTTDRSFLNIKYFLRWSGSENIFYCVNRIIKPLKHRLKMGGGWWWWWLEWVYYLREQWAGKRAKWEQSGH